MTENSLSAFIQTEEQRLSNKNLCFEALKTERNQSRFEIGRKANVSDIEAQRRLSDLCNEDKAEITGTRKHFKCEISLYSVKNELVLFPRKNKPTLRKWLKERYPNIYNEFEKEFS